MMALYEILAFNARGIMNDIEDDRATISLFARSEPDAIEKAKQLLNRTYYRVLKIDATRSEGE